LSSQNKKTDLVPISGRAILGEHVIIWQNTQDQEKLKETEAIAK
jgi:hypothetical protein